MLEVMARLDEKASDLYHAGADDFGLFINMSDVMPDFKTLLGKSLRSSFEAEIMNFPVLHRYALVLSNMAKGLADGSIDVPK
ncbi:arylsulfatase regulator [Martelella alba]|uniref:Arylsulfatase regulator n=2 Tax=Martelella alba TaxID=2590451 RepID=A0A506TZN5_9HYPH|nr:arylsulfatase regulator [Martelella alba]